MERDFFLTRFSRTTTVLTINFLSHLVPSFPFLMFPCLYPISSFVFLSAYSGSRKSTKSDTSIAYVPHVLWNIISFNPHKSSLRTITYNFLKIRKMREFPGGLVVRTPHFYYRQPEELRSHKLCGVAKIIIVKSMEKENQIMKYNFLKEA